MEKSPEAYRTIREVADLMDLPQHVLRFWETRFPQIRPLKRAGGRRYYRPEDIERLRLIRRLLYDEGYTIKGVQKLFRGQGVQAVSGGAAFHDGSSAEAPDAVASRASQADGAGKTKPRLQANDLAALRAALAEIVDAERILAQARSLGSSGAGA
jgi:DNA-binding transcriptional MerR regulator